MRLPVRSCCLAAMLALAVSFSARAQTATVSGFVTDQSSGQPLEFVNVAVRPVEGEIRGATSDQDGAYIIPRLPLGRYVLNATFIGYATYADTLDLTAPRVYTVNIELAPVATGLGEVVLESERTTGAARPVAGQQTVDPADVELVPSPDISADLVSYLTTVPGIVSTGDRGGQLFIRGGEPSQNLVQLDGIPLFQPFHLLGFYSAFPAEIMNKADVYAGGFGAQFGGRVSSVLDVTSRTGNERIYAGAVSLSPFVSSANVEGPLVRDRFSFIGSIRQSLIEQGAGRIVGADLPFNFGDAFVKVNGRIGNRSRISATGIRTYDRGRVGEDLGAAPPEEIQWENVGVGLRWVVLPKLLPVTTALNVTHSRLTSSFAPLIPDTSSVIRGRTSEVYSTKVGVDASFVGRSIDVDAGWVIEGLDINSELGGVFQNTEFRATTFTSFAAYVEPEFQFGRLKIRPGVRMQYYQVRFDPYVEPRVRLIYDGGKHQISAAVGRYNQEIVGLNDRRDAASVFTVWAYIPQQTGRNEDDVTAGRLAESYHGILGYRVSPTGWLDLSVEGFYRSMSNLFVSEWTAFPRLTTRLQPAKGRSAGFDLRAEFRPGRFYGFVNYGYSNTIYWARQASLLTWYGTDELRYRPPHDRRHQVNALLSTRIKRFDVSARWAFGSGLPFSQARGFDGFVLVNDIRDLSRAFSTRRVLYDEPYGGVMPTYHRLDLSVERMFVLPLARVTVMGSVINAYDRRNLFYLDVFTLRRADQLPIVPSVGVKAEF